MKIIAAVLLAGALFVLWSILEMGSRCSRIEEREEDGGIDEHRWGGA